MRKSNDEMIISRLVNEMEKRKDLISFNATTTAIARTSIAWPFRWSRGMINSLAINLIYSIGRSVPTSSSS